MDCECVGWARIMDAGELPISLHNPNCPRYVLEPFTRIDANGTFCIQEGPPEDIGDDFDGCISVVYMTRDQFDNLPEFQGF